MAGVSLSLAKGQDGMRASDFVTGTLVPGAGDVGTCSMFTPS